VKTRKSSRKGKAVESITDFKKKRLLITGKYYIMYHPEFSNCDLRFDLAAIEVSADSGTKIEYIENIIEDTSF